MESNVSNLKLTVHACERFKERFPAEKLGRELKQSRSFGCSSGRVRMLLSPCGAVFIVKNDAIVTALTREQAMSNDTLAAKAVSGTSGLPSALREAFNQLEVETRICESAKRLANIAVSAGLHDTKPDHHYKAAERETGLTLGKSRRQVFRHAFQVAKDKAIENLKTAKSHC